MDKYIALADPTRRNIIELLANEGSLAATEIYEKFQVSPQAISQHLKVLREASLVRVEKRAQQRIYQINPDAMVEVEEWTRKMRLSWSRHFDFDALDKVLNDEKERILKINEEGIEVQHD